MLKIRFVEVHMYDKEGHQRIEVKSYEINYIQATLSYKKATHLFESSKFLELLSNWVILLRLNIL